MMRRAVRLHHVKEFGLAGFQPLWRPVGPFDDSDDIDDWMARRNAEVASRDDAEAAGREAWAQGIGSDGDVDASTPHDLIRLGQETLAQAGDHPEQDNPDPTSIERTDPVQPDGPLIHPPALDFDPTRPRHAEAADGGQRGAFPARESHAFGRVNGTRLTPRTPAAIHPGDLAARQRALWAGYFGGILPGAVRGAQRATEGVVASGLRTANPLDRATGRSPLEPFEPLALGLVGNAVAAVRHPAVAWEKTKLSLRGVAEAVIPGLAPLPATVEAARQQGRRVGMNDGEIGVNIAAIPLGGEAAEGLEASALRRSAVDAAGYEKRGVPAEIASYFTEPYEGMGSHWFSRDATWPAFLGGGKLPSWFIESRYNVWKPGGATRGQVYEGHYLNDLRFGGGRLPGATGKGSGWSGKRLGWQKNPPVTRFIERMPAVTKGTLAGAGLAASDAARAGGAPQ